MKITRFAQNIKTEPYQYWVEYEDGSRQNTDTDEIQQLWRVWIVADGSERQDEDGWNIFAFGKDYLNSVDLNQEIVKCQNEWDGFTRKEKATIINEDKNRENIYAMLHEFRNWNREWDLYMAKNPNNADEFVDILNKKYEVKILKPNSKIEDES